jgi:hypothetical protein
MKFWTDSNSQNCLKDKQKSKWLKYVEKELVIKKPILLVSTVNFIRHVEKK